jgi:hypothetical protein
MKIEYLPSQGKKQGPRFYLRPENAEEQRLLTIWHDLYLEDPECLFRLIGAERSDKNVSGMPARPVLNLGMTIVDKNGMCPEKLRPSKQDALDPTKPVKRTDQAHTPLAAVMSRKNTRVIRGVPGESTVFIEGD